MKDRKFILPIIARCTNCDCLFEINFEEGFWLNCPKDEYVDYLICEKCFENNENSLVKSVSYLAKYKKIKIVILTLFAFILGFLI
jgi:hypothetical protein